MSEVVTTFGMCSVMVIADSIPFKGVFIIMCGTLKLNYWCLSRGNHRGNSVELYHHFLDKTQAIIWNNRDTHTIILKNTKTSQYTWNSALIDNMGITRSMLATGRIFKFPLDVELFQTPRLINSSNSSLFSYFHKVSTYSVFTLSILLILISDQRIAHQERQNVNKIVCN